MLLRLLLAISVAATGAGLAAPSVGAAPSRTDAVVLPVTDDDGAAEDTGVEVTSATLVVASESEAAAATAESLGGAAPDAAPTAPAPTASPTPSPTPAPTGTPGAAPTGDAAADAGAEQRRTRDLITPRATDDEAAEATVDPEQDTVVADALTEDGRVLTAAVSTAGVQTIGVTWPTGADAAGLAPEARTLTDGTWSGWSALDVADSAPDEGTADAAAQQRGGTDSFWIGEAEAVQLSFAATDAGGPADLDLTLVGSELTDDTGTGSGTAQASATGEAVFSTALATAPAAVRTAAAPRIITRAEWGSRAPVCAPDVASSLVGAVVHHTAGSNAYGSVAAAMQQIRNDQAYHISGRGWCDLGYNFVVDKWGNIYEGRIDSMSKAVIGVHAGGFNTGTVGVAMLGTYDGVPSAATQQAVGQVIGWRLGAYGRDPRGWMSYTTGNGENSKYHNTTVSLPRVFGHRDVSYTACPGNGGYAALPNIREVAAANAVTPEQLKQAESVVRAMYQDLLGRAPDSTGLVRWRTALVSGGTAADVAAEITRSEEYNRQKIAAAYRTVLGRTTDEPGVLSWLAAIHAGTVKIDEIANHLVASDEFYLQSGRTDAGLVQSMYTKLLGRAGSASEVSYWTTRVPSLGRGGVISSVTGSREAAQRKVQLAYRLFLNRYPDIPGQSHWTDILLAQGEAAVRANILGSAEYRLRAIQRYP
jgi:hypothetical protein